MRLLVVSATNRLPVAESMATSDGYLKLAAVPMPLVNGVDNPVPAKVDTVPSDNTFLMR